jgi:Ser/Thr protein kinase RdoA (MazF antagonist)
VLADSGLDRGICHMDNTLDNLHRDSDSLTLFDFDIAGACWRSIEPHGVLRLSQEYFQAWLEGYRAVRSFDSGNERAVEAFAIIGDFRVVAWKLGVAKSSRGQPLLGVSGLTEVVDKWLEWEGDHA